jgi:hypothetical protein
VLSQYISAHDTNGAVYKYGYERSTLCNTYTYYDTGTATIDYRLEACCTPARTGSSASAWAAEQTRST